MLYLVATPIGNLGDITLRALEVLKSVDVIAAEDTRHSGNLLRHHGISKPLISFHEHNEAARTEELIGRLAAGANVAIVTDAGLPGISDPGHRLVAACAARNLPYTVIPGASSVLTALVGSTFAVDQFFYGGFLPNKSGGREREVANACARAEASVFFESPHRLLRTLEVFQRLAPARELCVARELTKQFEEFRVGTAAVLISHYEAQKVRGEITLVVAPLSRAERRDRASGNAEGFSTAMH